MTLHLLAYTIERHFSTWLKIEEQSVEQQTAVRMSEQEVVWMSYKP